MLEVEVRFLKGVKFKSPKGGDQNCGQNNKSRKYKDTLKDRHVHNAQSKRPDWMYKPILPSNPNENKQWGRNTYWFCGGVTGGHYKKWQCHKGSAYKASSYEANTKLGTLTKDKPDTQDKRRMQPAQSINDNHKKVRSNGALIAQMEQTKDLIAEMDKL